MSGWVKKLKTKWNVEKNRDFILIMTVFSLAGMGIMFERKPLFHLIGITAQTPLLFKIFLYLATVPFFYQLNLLVFGFLFGQFPFFWEKEKRLGRFFKRVLSQILLRQGGTG